MAVAKFSGIASGIDSASLIDALIKVRQQTNELRRAEIEYLNSENDALDELNTKLLGLHDLIDKFRTVNGGGVSKKATSSDSTVATAAASGSASNGSIGLTVTSVASAATASFNDNYTSGTSQLAPNLVAPSSVTISVGQGSNLVSEAVSITSTMTAAEFVDAVNNTSAFAGRLSAALVNTGTSSSPAYRVVFNTLNTGQERGLIAITPPTLLEVGGNSDLQAQTVDQATNAAFTVDGIGTSITRATNSISDVIPGVTFSLAKTGSTTITVSDDSAATLDNFKQIVEAYNDIVEFANENNLIERSEEGTEVKNIFGTLAKTNVDDDFLSQFRTAFGDATAESGTAVRIFAELGVSTNRDGTLTLDEDEFREGIGTDPTGAAELLRAFADEAAGVDGFVSQFTRFNGFVDIAQNANNEEIEDLNDSIAQLNRQTDKMRENLEGQFARLESLTAQLQNTQAALTSILAGLSTK